MKQFQTWPMQRPTTPENSFLSNLFMSVYNQENRIQDGPEAYRSRTAELGAALVETVNSADPSDIIPGTQELFQSGYKPTKTIASAATITELRPKNNVVVEAAELTDVNQIRASIDNVYSEGA